ncbi:MAG: DUF4348 domain-containing protein [Saprospiraceae bacterium]
MFRNTLIFICFLALSACRDKKNAPAQTEQTASAQSDQVPADFSDFYQKFHTDSLYQIAHISWPLQGMTTVSKDSSQQEQQGIYWEKATWTMHRPVNFASGEFKRTLQVLGNELVVEQISYAAASYGLERRFVRSENGEWELIYYADMHQTGK